MRAAAAELPEPLQKFSIVIECAFPEHDPDADSEAFADVYDDEDLNQGCQCRDCQIERGTLDTVPEPVTFEIFY